MALKAVTKSQLLNGKPSARQAAAAAIPTKTTAKDAREALERERSRESTDPRKTNVNNARAAMEAEKSRHDANGSAGKARAAMDAEKKRNKKRIDMMV